MSSHRDPKVNDEFSKWLNKKFGDHKKVTEHRGRKHDYLGMNMIFHDDGILEIEMKDYVQGMIDTFPIKFNGNRVSTLAAAR